MPHRPVRSLSLLLRVTSAMTAASLLASPAFALPQGGQVVGGQANIASSGSQTTIVQSTDRGIIHWQSFDIAHGEHVRFQQPSASSVTLNRVTGGQGASQIMGSLTANGTVMLVNPNGVIFGPTSQVNVGSLVATTADIADDRFLAGDYRFDKPGNPNAGIINQGRVTVAEAGLAAFVAPNVANDGIIEARLGTIELASGDRFTLDLYGDGLIHLEASDAIQSQLVSNSGILSAKGGRVALTAAAASDVVNSLINTDGIIEATSIGEQNGEIVIFAEGSNAVKGNDPARKGKKQGSSTVLVSGVLDVSGRKVGERGGKLTVTGDNVALMNGTVIDASGHTGLSGTTAGKAVSAYRDGSAGGDIRIGGDYLGQGNTPTAQNLYVDPGALILNDSLHTGDAGRTIFWSDGTTQFYGNVYARALGGKPVDPLTWNASAGGHAGDGGFVETSGHKQLDAGGYVNLTASSGEKGTYFLDPTDITIYGNVDPAFVSTDGSINLAADLKLWLDASDTSKVTLTYSTDGLAGATATGTSGSNTITTSADVSANLAVGARIRLGSAGSVTTADTVGADTYTISAISGTTITLSSNLSSNYSGSTLHRGLVSQFADKSGQGNNATQATAANMPLWIGDAQGAKGKIKYDGQRNPTGDFLSFIPFAQSPQQSIFSTLTSSALGLGHEVLLNRAYTNNGPAAYVTDGSTGTLLYWDGPGGYFIPNVAPNPAYKVSYWAWNGTSITVGDNGAVTSVSAAKSNVDQWVSLGSTAGGQVFSGTLGDVLIYDTALATNARNLVEQSQSAKWGVALTPPGTGATEVAKATASDGYSAFTTRYLERLSQSANVSLQATNNITLDLKGDTLALASNRDLTLATTNGNISSVSAGTITTNRTSTGGNISITAGGIGSLNLGNITLNALGGGDVTLQSVANMTLGNVNAGTLAGAVNGGGNLTVSAAAVTLSGNLGAGTPLAAVSLTSANGLALPSISASSIFARTTGAAADLTIASGASLTASGSGTPLTLVAGRNFVNNAGSGALSTPSGRWLVYSTSPTADAIGGLSASFRRFSCAYSGSCPSFPAGGNGFLYNSTPLLTARPVGLTLAAGSPVPNLAGYGYTLTGYLSGDGTADTVTGSLTGTTPYTPGRPAGAYALDYASGTLTSALGYGFAYASDPAGLTVRGPVVAGGEVARIVTARPTALPPIPAGPSAPAVAAAAPSAGGPRDSFQDAPPLEVPGKPIYSLLNNRMVVDVDPSLQWFFNVPPRL